MSNGFYKLSAIRAYLFSKLPGINLDEAIGVGRKSGQTSELSAAILFSRTMGLDPRLEQDLQLAEETIERLVPVLSVINSDGRGTQLVKALENRSALVTVREILPAVLPISSRFQGDEVDFPENYRDEWQDWWEQTGKDWATKLLEAIAQSKRINEAYLQENQERPEIQKETNQNYYYFCFLLANCLNRAAIVSDAVRQKIETELLTCQSR